MELGPLSAIASQPGVTDIAVTCDGTVWADCGQGMQEVCLLRRCFPSAQSIREFAARLCSQLGRRLDDACPIADASTVDGLRVHAVIAPLVPQGAAISIRLPDAVSPDLESLARNGMFPAEWLPLLAGLVSRKASVLVTGGTGAGKTTMLKAMLMRCPPNERIVTVEEVRELGMIQHANHVSLVTREANTEGAGGIGLSELICATLRMRPDRVVVGECRGGEVVDLLRALNSGHRGGMTTLHANQVEAVPARLVSLGLLAGLEPRATAALAEDAFDVVLHVERIAGRRRIAQVGRLEAVEGRLHGRLLAAWGWPYGPCRPTLGWIHEPMERMMRDACGWEYCAAWLASMAVWLWLNRNAEWAGLRRLQRVLVRFGLRSADDSGGADGDGTCNDESDGHGRTVRNDGGNRDASPRMPTIGAAACVAALRASVRSGATLVQAFEELQGAPFAVPELTRFRIDMAVRSRCSLQEQHKHVNQLGVELHAACTLSLQLGCEMSRCLEAVAASLKRRRLLDDLRANAFAMPQATVKLLMALPLLTVMLGECMGAHPLRFLVEDVKGWMCLWLRRCCYAVGWYWIRRLMRQEHVR